MTHVNFFTRGALRHLTQRAGLGNVDARLGAYRHASGRQLLAVRAVGGPNGNDSARPVPGCAETERLLQPGLAERFHRSVLTPVNIIGALRYQVLHRLCGNRGKGATRFRNDR